MFYKQKLWSVRFSASLAASTALADALGEDCLAVTIMTPPRIKHAQIEALYATEPDRAALTAHLSVVALLNKISAPKLEIRELPRLDWLKKVAADFPPLSVARWTVYGAQYRKAVPNRRLGLQIDATSAFGTGEHPTTRGCLMMLDRILKQKTTGRKMLDMGCGSGILAMAYVKSTRGKAVAVDMDLNSVAIVRENAKVNGLAKNICIAHSLGYRARCVKSSAPYDLIMANIFAGPLSHMAKDLKKYLRPGGTAILAGLLNQQAKRVIAAHRMQKLYVTKRLVIGEWSILALKRRQRA